MKKILVTGANGFTGSHILLALTGLAEEAGIQTIAACRDASTLPAEYQGEVRVGDLRDGVYRKKVLKGVDMVCHAAAWSSLWGNEALSHSLYLEPSLALLDDCVAAGVERFLFVSSTSAPGPAAGGDALAPGLRLKLWPHMANVSRIEEAMRAKASDRTCMVNLRCGLFAGARYGLGLLPILLPRLKTHLVPWIKGGRTHMPIIDGRDIGQAFALAVRAEGLSDYESFNIIGPELPTAREVMTFLRTEFGYPTPHFSVPFPIGYGFAWMMEKLDAIVPWEPLVVRSIIHLLEETHADNGAAEQRLGYRPTVHWKEAIRSQIDEMKQRQTRPMSMAKPVVDAG